MTGRFSALDAVVGGGGIFRLARYDLHGVWKQAGDGAAGQQDALRALAPHPAGPREPEIRAGAGLGTAELQQALQTLTRHDVVHQEGGRWRITVELFRRWVEAGAE